MPISDDDDRRALQYPDLRDELPGQQVLLEITLQAEQIDRAEYLGRDDREPCKQRDEGDLHQPRQPGRGGSADRAELQRKAQRRHDGGKCRRRF